MIRGPQWTTAYAAATPRRAAERTAPTHATTAHAGTQRQIKQNKTANQTKQINKSIKNT